MTKYKQLATSIIQYVGGKDNVVELIHCVTRLRFTLEDVSKVDSEKLRQLDGVISTLNSGGQYQVVIGNQVADVYAEVCKEIGQGAEVLATRNQPKKKKSIWEIILDVVSNVFTPILPVLCAAGMIKGLNVLAVFLNVYGKDSSWYTLFNGLGDALFFFFPIMIGYTAAVKFKLKPLVGMVMGAMLCYPSLNGAELNFFGSAFTVSYTATVLPIIVLCAIAAPLERFLDSKLPLAVRSFLSPLLVLLIVVPLAYLFIGPLVNSIAVGISGVLNSLYGFNPVIAGFIIASLFSVLVVFGVHGPLMMLLIMNIMGGTPDGIYAVISAQSFAISGTLLGIWLKTKDSQLKSVSFGAWLTSIFGVTEPAIYGILLPKIKYFVVSCIGAGLGGAYLALMGIKAYQMAGMGIFRIPAFLEPQNVSYSLTHVLIAYAISIIFCFVVTFIIFKDEKSEDIEVFSPIKGKKIKLEDVNDAVFSTKIMGEGVAVLPTEGVIYAPFDGEVALLFPTCHAVGFKSRAGSEILVHLGLDTVNLQGQFFESHVKQGDTVKKGQKIISFDIEAIAKAGYSLETPIVLTNGDNFVIRKETNATVVDNNQELFSVTTVK